LVARTECGVTNSSPQCGVDVQTRVVSVSHYRDGHQLERWFYREESTTASMAGMSFSELGSMNTLSGTRTEVMLLRTSVAGRGS
jgi:hypothetical protein